MIGVALALLATGCSGGGHSGAGPTTTDVIDQATPGGERPIQFTGAGKVTLSGTFAVPNASGSGPAASAPGVLFVPALGDGTRDGPISGTDVPDPIAQDLAHSFTAAGMATLRYDRRGTGESKLDPGVALSFDDMVADAKAGVDFLAQRKETSGRRLAVVGYGEGGLVALRLAATDPRVTRVVLVSSVGRPVVDVQASRLSATYGQESGDALHATVASMLATGQLPPLEQMRSEIRPLLPAAEIPFLSQVYSLDPAAEAAKVQVPVLVAIGSASNGAGPADADRLAQALGGRAQVVVGANDDESLEQVKAPPAQDPSDPTSPNHEHGMGPASTTGDRDATLLGQMSSWLGAGLGAHAA
jgi:pimeloyl-ACP methyl ester carboxylesterase